MCYCAVVTGHVAGMTFFPLFYVKMFSLLFFLQNKEGKSPLHMAAMHGRFTGSQILIQNGNINDKKKLSTESFLLDDRYCTVSEIVMS